ncbi:MAG: efflux RND transporter periplasmic adaptor subunit [Acidobacteriota bacterium]
MKKAGLVLLTLIVLGFGTYLMWGSVSERVRDWLTPANQEPVPTMTAEQQTYRLIVPADGELLGLSTTPVMTPRVRTGSLKISWLADEGRVVNAGQEIVQFDPTDAQLSLQQSQNMVESYDYRITQTDEGGRGNITALQKDQEAADLELEFARDQIRKDEDIFSRWDIEESVMSAALAEYRKDTVKSKVGLQKTVGEADLKILDISQEKAKVEMNMAKETLDALTLTAPEQGVLIYERRGLDPLEVGSEVWPGQPVLQIASLDKFRARVQIPEKDVAAVRRGQEVNVTLEAFPAETFTGKVSRLSRIAKQVDRNDPRKYFECDVLLDVPLDEMEKLKPGMSAHAQIQVGEFDDAFVLPRSSLIKKDTGWVVFLAEKDGQYVEQSVEILGSDHGFYLVRGLDEGMTVCLRHPFESQKLALPDFNAAAAPPSQERFVIFR